MAKVGQIVMYTDDDGTFPAMVTSVGTSTDLGAEGTSGQIIVVPFKDPGKAAVPAGTDATNADGTFTEVS